MSNDPQNPDVRWQQRFQNYQLALTRLSAAVALSQQRPLSDLERQGLVQAFEFTHELAWNVLKDYLEEQGVMEIIGSKTVSRAAFRSGLIEDGEAWMEMIKARNLSSHTYQEEIAENIVKAILARFYPALLAMERRFAAVRAQERQNRSR
jgi:nucleotidyltransferase substrate binding protein (TIGR01987 family)